MERINSRPKEKVSHSKASVLRRAPQTARIKGVANRPKKTLSSWLKDVVMPWRKERKLTESGSTKKGDVQVSVRDGKTRLAKLTTYQLEPISEAEADEQVLESKPSAKANSALNAYGPVTFNDIANFPKSHLYSHGPDGETETSERVASSLSTESTTDDDADSALSESEAEISNTVINTSGSAFLAKVIAGKWSKATPAINLISPKPVGVVPVDTKLATTQRSEAETSDHIISESSDTQSETKHSPTDKKSQVPTSSTNLQFDESDVIVGSSEEDSTTTGQFSTVVKASAESGKAKTGSAVAIALADVLPDLPDDPVDEIQSEHKWIVPPPPEVKKLTLKDLAQVAVTKNSDDFHYAVLDALNEVEWDASQYEQLNVAKKKVFLADVKKCTVLHLLDLAEQDSPPPVSKLFSTVQKSPTYKAVAQKVTDAVNLEIKARVHKASQERKSDQAASEKLLGTQSGAAAWDSVAGRYKLLWSPQQRLKKAIPQRMRSLLGNAGASLTSGPNKVNYLEFAKSIVNAKKESDLNSLDKLRLEALRVDDHYQMSFEKLRATMAGYLMFATATTFSDDPAEAFLECFPADLRPFIPELDDNQRAVIIKSLRDGIMLPSDKDDAPVKFAKAQIHAYKEFKVGIYWHTANFARKQLLNAKVL